MILAGMAAIGTVFAVQHRRDAEDGRSVYHAEAAAAAASVGASNSLPIFASTSDIFGYASPKPNVQEAYMSLSNWTIQGLRTKKASMTREKRVLGPRVSKPRIKS